MFSARHAIVACAAAALPLLAACDSSPTGDNPQAAPPTLTVVSPASGATVYDSTLLVQATAADTAGVASVWYRVGSAQPVRVPTDTMAKTVTVSFSVPLAMGANDVQVYALDRTAQQGSATVHVTRGQLRTLTGAKSVSLGDDHGCAAMADGTVYCWGQGYATLVATDARFASVAAGGGFTCGLTAAGEAWCWGANDRGQLGDGTTTAHAAPARVSGGLTFQALAAGDTYACGLTAAGAAYCWGHNEAGQLGDSTTTSRSVPTKVVGGLTFTAIDAGTIGTSSGKPATCGVSGGKTYCWGDSGRFRIANLKFATVVAPTLTQPAFAAARVHPGDPYVWALGTDGNVYQWGCSSPSDEADGHCLTAASLGSGGTYTAFAAGPVHACMLNAGGEAYCVGVNASGEGGSTASTLLAAPTRVIGGLTFRSIAAANAATCAVSASADATVYCWGRSALNNAPPSGATFLATPRAVLAP